MKVTLIGGSGFIGSNLMGVLLADNIELKNLDKNVSAVHPEITSIVDIREPGPLQQSITPADWIILLAAEHTDNVDPVSLYYDVNVEGTRNVLDVMREKGINKIIFTSSVAVYGLNKQDPTEYSPLAPFNHYGKSKAVAEQVLSEWYKEDEENRTLVIIRPTVVFGPGNRGNVYNLLQQIARGKFLMIGKGENKKSMAFIGNVVAFIKHCVHVNLKGYNIFNYIDKPDLATKELIQIAGKVLNKKTGAIKIPFFIGTAGGHIFDLISKISGKSFSVSSIRVRKFCATTQFSSVNIENTGFKAPYTLEHGLELTMKDIVIGNKHPVEEEY